MNGKQMTLLETWRGQDVTGWFSSEKFGGVRAYWDGYRMWTRGGAIINAPESFTRQLPKGFHLDGELWAGRGRFTEARLAAQYGRWTVNVRLAVFDCPLAHGRWQDRMLAAQQAIAGCEVAFPVEWCSVRNIQHACILFKEVRGRRGEGLVLRHPQVTGYEVGRSRNALKVRTLPACLNSA